MVLLVLKTDLIIVDKQVRSFGPVVKIMITLEQLPCLKEDQGFYLCLAKRNIFEETIKGGLYWIEITEGISQNNLSWIDHLHGHLLTTSADDIFNNFWHQIYLHGVSCDFEGAAELIEIPIQNNTYNQTYPPNKKYIHNVNNLLLLAILFVLCLIITFGSILVYMFRLRYLRIFTTPGHNYELAEIRCFFTGRGDYMSV